MTLGKNLAKPLIISCAITGGITAGEQAAGLPVMHAEVAASAIETATSRPASRTTSIPSEASWSTATPGSSSGWSRWSAR